MKVQETTLPGVRLLMPTIHRDNRGAFWETWSEREAADLGLPTNWVQDNFSVSQRNVVRGIHYQLVQPQDKLLRVTHGALLDVAVDLRRSSPAFAQHVAVKMTAENGEMLYIPRGFGHAFVALTEVVGLAYKVTDFYCAAGDRTIVWDDPDLAIPWPVGAANAILSDKDRNGARLCDAEVFA